MMTTPFLTRLPPTEDDPFPGLIVVAEPGSCPNWPTPSLGKMELAIRIAAEAGCDVVKPQWCSNPHRLAERRHIPEAEAPYQALAWPLGWHRELDDLAVSLGLEYAVSVYLPEDVWPLAEAVPRVIFKVASFEAGDRRLIETILATRHPWMLSTGMQDWWHHGGLLSPFAAFPRDRLAAVFHTVSAYPTPVSEAGLAGIRGMTTDLEIKRQWRVGYSDHTRYPATGALAVAAGARILEVHSRLEDTSEACPDFVVALGPVDLKAYVDMARAARDAVGPPGKRRQPSEALNLAYRVESA